MAKCVYPIVVAKSAWPIASLTCTGFFPSASHVVFKNPPESLCDLAASCKAQYSNDLSIDLLTYILFVVLLLQQHNGDLEVCHANNECFWGGH